MELPPLCLEQLSKVLDEAPTPQALYDTLCQYEATACLLFTDTEVTGDAQLLSVFYASYLISLLLTEQTCEARMLTHRMPQALVKGDAVLQNSISLLRAVWQNKYLQVYRILREQSWPGPMNGIVQKYESFFRVKTFRGISQVYEAIRPEAAAAYLGFGQAAKEEMGISAEEPSSTLIGWLTSMEWTWDAEEGLFHPKIPVGPSDTKNVEMNGISQLMDLIGNYGDR